MRIQLPWLLAVGLLVPSTAHADDHKADFMFAISWAKGSTLTGGHAAFAQTLPMHEFSFVGDVSYHFGSEEVGGVELDVTRVVNLYGGRYTVPLQSERYRPFLQFLLGFVRDHAGQPSNTDFAVGFGGGFEIRLRGAADSGPAGRIQIDVIKGPETFARFSAGGVLRFGPY